MERLIADANEYAESIGQASDLSIENFSDVVTAIDLVQQKQQIAGTTQREAASTIQGSLGMLKSAWENLVIGFSSGESDIDELINNVVEALETAFKNIAPVAERALSGIAEGVKKIAPIIGQKLPEIIIEIAPDLLNAGIGFITGLAQGIIEGFPVLVQSIEENLPAVQETLSKAFGLTEEDEKRFAEAWEKISATIDGALMLLKPAFDDISKALQPIIDKFKAWVESGDALKTVTFVIQMIVGAVTAVVAIVAELVAAWLKAVDFIIEYTNKGLQVFVALKDGIAAALEGLVTFYTETLPWALQKFGETLISIGDAIRTFFTETIPEWLNTALEFIQNCINNIVAFFTESLPNAIENFKTKLSAAGDSIRLFFTKSIPNWIDELFKKLKELPEKAMTFGKDFVEGLWNGIQDMGAWLKEKIEGFGEDVLGDLKDFFGIASPSKVMRDVIGKNLMLGLGEGIEDNKDDALTSALSAAESITKAFDLSSALGGLNPTAELSLATANTALKASTAQSGSTVPIVLNIDGRTLAKVLYPYNTAESQRRGLTIVTGG